MSLELQTQNYFHACLGRIYSQDWVNGLTPLFVCTTSCHTYAKGTPSHFIWHRLFIHFRFQVLFHSLTGVLFTFPLRYLFTIGLVKYLGFEGGPPKFNIRLLICYPWIWFYGAVTLFGKRISRRLWHLFQFTFQRIDSLVRFRSRLLTKSRLMSFRIVTEMFQFTILKLRGFPVGI